MQPDMFVSEPALRPTDVDVSVASETVSVVDPRNALNDLVGEQWLPETKSFFFQKGLGASHAHAQIERQHPAPFSFQDVQRLIAFFTKSGQTVLDPFAGVGSTAKAAALLGRRAVCIELSDRWHDLAVERLETEVGKGEAANHRMIRGDAREVLPTIGEGSVDFVVTSPPYWGILNKKPDHKALERVRDNLALRYSDEPEDLGNIREYSTFLDELTPILLECGRALKTRGYMAVIVSDFRHEARFFPFHCDLLTRLDQARPVRGPGLALQGIKVLLQNHKSLKPYGYPFAYVENIHHQHILIFRKTLARS